MDLPFAVDDEPSSPGTAAGTALVPSVLIVDDEPVVLDVFKSLLAREADLFVATAETAEAGLTLLHERRFDLLITDKNLPGMGGLELIAKARAQRPNLEAIMITGYASAESVLAALAAGASDYLRKPFDDLKMVRARIRAALGRRAERVQVRSASERIAREAAQLLAQGKLVPDPVWDALERELAVYERVDADEPSGVVRVVGITDVSSALLEPPLGGMTASSDEPSLEAADVVVLDTHHPGWRELADRLSTKTPDVVLLARPDADLADLLDALSLHMDLVGFGVGRDEAQAALKAKVRGLLMRRSIERRQATLSLALDAFREALQKA